jgi:hypothetical protein
LLEMLENLARGGISMDEVVLTYPNVCLYYRAEGRPYGGPALFKEIEDGTYGYRLKVGQTLESIRYHGTNYDIYVKPTVLEIKKDGLTVAYHSPFTELYSKKTFIPYKKLLPNGGKYEIRDMYIEPCGELYEKNKLADVLAGTIATETWIDDKWDKRIGEGIWYHHGGTRTPVGRDENLRNFVKTSEQISLFEEE